MSGLGALRRERLPDGQFFVDVDIDLRTHQTDYLERVAERDGTNLSDALGCLIERNSRPSLCQSDKPAKKIRKHLRFHPKHLALIDRIAGAAGLLRSEVIRRIIDEASAREAVSAWTSRT